MYTNQFTSYVQCHTLVNFISDLFSLLVTYYFHYFLPPRILNSNFSDFTVLMQQIVIKIQNKFAFGHHPFCSHETIKRVKGMWGRWRKIQQFKDLPLHSSGTDSDVFCLGGWGFAFCSVIGSNENPNEAASVAAEQSPGTEISPC